MDDLDKKLYKSFSRENIEKEIARLKEKQEKADNDFDRFYWGLRIKDWNDYLRHSK